MEGQEIHQKIRIEPWSKEDQSAHGLSLKETILKHTDIEH